MSTYRFGRLGLAALGALAACATVPRARVTTLPVDPKDNGPRLHLALIYQQQSELEPCGCATGMKGGVARAYRALRSWKELTGHDARVVGAGSMFASELAANEAKRPDATRKAGYVIEGLDLLGTQAIGLTADDFLLGTDELRKLAGRASFPFVASNLVAKDGAPLPFPRYAKVTVGGRETIFVSLSAPPKMATESALEIRVQSPADALKALSETLPTDRATVLALTNLPASERAPLQRQFPWIRVWLGGESKEITHEPFNRVAPGIIELRASERMRALSFLDLALEPERPLYNFREQLRLQGQQKNLKRDIARWEADLRRKDLTVYGRDVTRHELEKGRQQLAATDALLRLRPETSAQFEYNTSELTDFYEPAEPNPGTAVIERYHGELVERALASQGSER